MTGNGVGHRSPEIESAIKEAVLFLPSNFLPRHEHSKRCLSVLKHILYNDEYTVIEAKQSMYSSVAPSRLVATNHRIIFVKPSFWSLWAGHNIFTSTKYESIHYNSIVNITLHVGRIFSTLRIHLNTMEEGGNVVQGLKTEDARAMFSFLEEMIESLRKHAYSELEPQREVVEML